MTCFLIVFLLMDGNNSERLAIMIVTLHIYVFPLLLRMKKKVVYSRKRHVTNSSLRKENESLC